MLQEAERAENASPTDRTSRHYTWHLAAIADLTNVRFAPEADIPTKSVLTHFGPQRKAALRFIFTKSLFARLLTQPFFPRLKSCGSAAGLNLGGAYQQRETE
jgi:hypothetical protein